MYKVLRVEEGRILFVGLDWRYLACIEAGEYVRKSIDPEPGYLKRGLVEV